jgi:hypothetical protein
MNHHRKKAALLTLVLLLSQAAAAFAQPKSGRWYYIQNKAFHSWLCDGAPTSDTRDLVHLHSPVGMGEERHYRFLLTASGEDGYYALLHLHTSKCVESAGHTVHLGDRDRGWGEEYFLFRPVDAGGGYCYLRLKRTGGYLRARDDGKGPWLLFSDPLGKGNEDQYLFRFSEEGPAVPAGPALAPVAAGERGEVRAKWRDDNHRHVQRYVVEVAGPFLPQAERLPQEAKWRTAAEIPGASDAGVAPWALEVNLGYADVLEGVPFEQGKKYAVRVRAYYRNLRQAVSDYRFVTVPNPG